MAYVLQLGTCSMPYAAHALPPSGARGSDSDEELPKRGSTAASKALPPYRSTVSGTTGSAAAAPAPYNPILAMLGEDDEDDELGLKGLAPPKKSAIPTHTPAAAAGSSFGSAPAPAMSRSASLNSAQAVSGMPAAGAGCGRGTLTRHAPPDAVRGTPAGPGFLGL